MVGWAGGLFLIELVNLMIMHYKLQDVGLD